MERLADAAGKIPALDESIRELAGAPKSDTDIQDLLSGMTSATLLKANERMLKFKKGSEDYKTIGDEHL
nr:hypothetical protein BaRGS_004090 [Batillaria attramentaria]